MPTYVIATPSTIDGAAFIAKYKPVPVPQEVRDARTNELLADLVAALKPFEFKEVVIRAYTPYFNDGDPCVNILTEPYFDGVNIYGELYSRRVEYKDTDLDEDTKLDMRAAQDIVFACEDRLCESFDTDFELTITFEGAAATVTHDHYNPEY